MTSQWIPRINQTICPGCGQCISACPAGVLGRQADKTVVLQPENCSYCAACEMVCPAGAIELPYLIVRQAYSEETRDASRG